MHLLSRTSAVSREGQNTPKLPGRTTSKVQSTDMPPTYTKRLGEQPCKSPGLLTREFITLLKRPKHSGADWERSWGATGHGPASNMDKTPRLATLEESGAAT